MKAWWKGEKRGKGVVEGAEEEAERGVVKRRKEKRGKLVVEGEEGKEKGEDGKVVGEREGKVEKEGEVVVEWRNRNGENGREIIVGRGRGKGDG